ncbi:MAG: TIGR00341 family protein, partial [Theionarchaea archaeon]|nr:TIGR00341 family protein [Theionarchaea archaeon]
NSLVLPLENVFGLMAGGLCATFLLDIRPRRYYEQVVARKVIFRTAVVLVILLGLLCVTSFYCN